MSPELLQIPKQVTVAVFKTPLRLGLDETQWRLAEPHSNHTTGIVYVFRSVLPLTTPTSYH